MKIMNLSWGSCLFTLLCSPGLQFVSSREAGVKVPIVKEDFPPMKPKRNQILQSLWSEAPFPFLVFHPLPPIFTKGLWTHHPLGSWSPPDMKIFYGRPGIIKIKIRTCLLEDKNQQPLFPLLRVSQLPQDTPKEKRSGNILLPFFLMKVFVILTLDLSAF